MPARPRSSDTDAAARREDETPDFDVAIGNAVGGGAWRARHLAALYRGRRFRTPLVLTFEWRDDDVASSRKLPRRPRDGADHADADADADTGADATDDDDDADDDDEVLAFDVTGARPA